MREVTVLAVPLILQNLSIVLLGVADTFFVSKISTAALAAVGLASVIYFAVMLLFRSTASSSVVFVGRAYGAKDYKQIGRAVWNVLSLITLLSLSTLFLPSLFEFIFSFAAPKDNDLVRQLGTNYLRIRSFEVPLVMFSAVVWGFLVGRGDSRTPMWLAWTTVVINIFLDWLLVLGNWGFPVLGVEGAAYASVIANACSAIASAFILWRPIHRARYATGCFHIASGQEFKQALKIGLPMGLGDFIEVSSFSTFFALIGRISTDTLAANQIALQYMSLSFTMGLAIAMASSSLVAKHLGAKEPESAEKVGYQATYLAMFLMGLIGLSYLIAPRALMGIFTNEAFVISTGVAVLRLVALYQIVDALAIVLGGALNGAGDTTFTMWTKMVFGWGVFLPLAWLFAFPLQWGVRGAWIGALIYLGVLGFVYLIRFRIGRWKQVF